MAKGGRVPVSYLMASFRRRRAGMSAFPTTTAVPNQHDLSSRAQVLAWLLLFAKTMGTSSPYH